MKQQQNEIAERLSSMRYSNTRGNIIPMHRALVTIEMSSFSRISAIIMPAVFCALIWLFMPLFIDGWGNIFEFWMQNIYGGHASFKEVIILGQSLKMPFPVLEAQAPSERMVYMNLLVCVIAFLISFIVPKRLAPLNYLVRAALLIQASASIDRIISPEDFPYTLEIYITDSLSLAVYLVFLLPVVLGFIYYIFDFGLLRKIALTVLMLCYYYITIPCQYMLHAYLINEYTLLMLPLMYLLFGTLLDVLMFVSIYSFGMSWHSNKRALEGRGLSR